MIYKQSRRAFGRSMAAAALLAATASTVHAASYPDRAVQFVVPFAAGGPSDVLARALAHKLSPALGQPVIVVNKPGAGTNLAAEFVARSPADGYTIFIMMVGTQAINEAMYEKLSYSTEKDFAPVSLIAASSLTLVAHPSFPAKNLPEAIALAKANPGRYNFGSSGAGTPLHLGGELLNKQAGISIQHVPYTGAAPALNDVLGGQIELAMVGTPSVLAHIKSGRLNAIGVTSAQRTSLAPDIPTIAETVPGYEVELVYAIVAPAGTPEPVIKTLNEAVHKAVRDPETSKTLTAQGFEVRTSTPAELGDYIRSEIAKWGPLVKASGVTAQ